MYIYRLATSPLLTLERHQKGVLSLSWCQQDPDLLLSASRDGKVLCWNPNNNIPVRFIFYLRVTLYRYIFLQIFCYILRVEKSYLRFAPLVNGCTMFNGAQEIRIL